MVRVGWPSEARDVAGCGEVGFRYVAERLFNPQSLAVSIRAQRALLNPQGLGVSIRARRTLLNPQSLAVSIRARRRLLNPLIPLELGGRVGAQRRIETCWAVWVSIRR